MDIFKIGDEVWFEYEIGGHSYERCGFILDGPFNNGFYRIRNAKNAVDFFIYKDKIHYERPVKEDNMKNTKLIRSNGTYKKEIKNVIFSGPVTTVVFDEEFDPFGRKVKRKTKTNVRCQEGDEFDKTTGFLLALVKTFVDKQSYDNILRTIDGFEEDKIEKHVKYTRKHIKLEKKCEDDCFKFKVGDIVRFEHGVARFKVDKRTTFTTKSGKVVPRYRLLRVLGTKYAYSTYANENELVLADEVYQK